MRRLGSMLCLTAVIAAGCGGGEDPSATRSVKLVTHDSFSISESVLDDFEKRTGIAIQIVQSGDAGEMVTRLALTKGKPVGDVAFGVDNTFLSRALEEDVFVPYESPRLVYVDDEYQLDDEFRVTPVDRGEVCINYDLRRFGADGPPAPSSLSDLTDPKYRNQLVVQNPATSSPGLAFLLATIARFGEPGWEEYWRGLKANGVEVAAGWEEAYNGRFSAGGGNGDRPMVVSYASSPPAAVHFAADPNAPATTAALEDGCFRQIEFAGILRGTEREDDARRVVDFLLSAEFQEDMPLNMFVFPVRNGTELPPVFEEHAAQPEEVLEMAPERIEANRERWIERWTSLMSG